MLSPRPTFALCTISKFELQLKTVMLSLPSLGCLRWQTCSVKYDPEVYGGWVVTSRCYAKSNTNSSSVHRETIIVYSEGTSNSRENIRNENYHVFPSAQVKYGTLEKNRI